MSVYLASYDIADDRQRTRVARVLSDFGSRIQQSVFEVDLEPSEIVEIQQRVGPLLSKDDLFDLIPVDLDPQRRRLRWQANPHDFDDVVVVD